MILTQKIISIISITLVAVPWFCNPLHTYINISLDVEKPVYDVVKLEINGTEQYVFLSGQDTDKPVMLFLHGGPGTPETPFIDKWNPGLKNHVILAMWEQRGSGKSFSSRIDPASMTTEQFLKDAHQVTQYLKERYDRENIILAGHSWGAILGIRLIKKYPEDYSAFISISQPSHAIREFQATYQWLTENAEAENNRKAMRQLKRFYPDTLKSVDLSDLSIKLTWVNHYGGGAFFSQKNSFRSLVWAVLTFRGYSLWDKLNYPRGERFTLKHMYEEIADLNLFNEINSVQMPVFFIHGQHDYQVPMEIAYDFYEHLQAPYKAFYVFNNSAHGVIIEEPENFNRLLVYITGLIKQQ